MKCSRWVYSLFDYDRDTEFTGDDADQYSSLIDLGDNYEFVTIMAPTLTSSTLGLAVQRDDAVATVPLPVYALDDDATGSFLHADTAATTARSVTFRLGGFQYFRIKCGSNQAANREFYVRGFNR